MAEKMKILRQWGFRRAFLSCEMKVGAAKWHSCAKGVFHNYENFRREGAWGYEIISQPSPDFAVGLLGLRNYFAANDYFRRGLF